MNLQELKELFREESVREKIRNKRRVKVLVACEYSGVVRDAFTRKGALAVSCDLLPTDSSGLHYAGDVRDILDFKWDAMIAHPPCTHLACSGAKHFAAKRESGVQQEALEFVRLMMTTNIPMWALENPVGIISTQIKKWDQIVQPYMFGDPFTKTTCPWLHDLPPLVPTVKEEDYDKGKMQICKSGKKLPEWYSNAKKEDRAGIRSKTFPGLAEAMADQWLPWIERRKL